MAITKYLPDKINDNILIIQEGTSSKKTATINSNGP